MIRFMAEKSLPTSSLLLTLMFWRRSPSAIFSRACRAYQRDLQVTVLTMKWVSQEQKTRLKSMIAMVA